MSPVVQQLDTSGTASPWCSSPVLYERWVDWEGWSLYGLGPLGITRRNGIWDGGDWMGGVGWRCLDGKDGVEMEVVGWEEWDGDGSGWMGEMDLVG